MIYNFLTQLSRREKQVVMLAVDGVLIFISVYLAYALRFATALPFNVVGPPWVLMFALTAVGIFFAIALGLHRIKLHSYNGQSMIRIGICAMGLAIAAMVLSYLLRLGAPRSVPIIFAVVFFLCASLSRTVMLYILNVLEGHSVSVISVAVYGAGASGIQLISALQQSREVTPVLLVDDNPSLHGLIIGGLKVESPKKLQHRAKNGRLDRVIVAIPSASRGQRDALIEKMSDLPCDIQVLPSIIDMISGKGNMDSLRVVAPEELLGRDKVDLNIPDVAKVYTGRVVVITGAGGSIGSELCRQLLNCNPKSIILFDQSEFALYSIDAELRPLADAAGISVISRLGSVTDRSLVEGIFTELNVEVVIHAAAYKHVPIVEENELEGVRNNVLGTEIVAAVSHATKVERFILVSTDKAVRPANVMGATKRLAEILVQDMQRKYGNTKFSIVRFGNVLGSSGSVIPQFQQQIAAGGPVTVTHPEVTRFFMTIPEASRLVLLAGAYSIGGDVFVLDMGKPIKIIDMARNMIELAGREVKKPGEVGDGIEIKITGLRPGEKMFEELLIDDNGLVSTPHKKILRAKESVLPADTVHKMLEELHTAVYKKDSEALRILISKWVDGYHTTTNLGQPSMAQVESIKKIVV